MHFNENKFQNELFLDAIIERIKPKNNLEIARALHLPLGSISQIRNGKLRIGNSILLYAHLATGISIKELKELAGIPPAVPYVPSRNDLRSGASVTQDTWLKWKSR